MERPQSPAQPARPELRPARPVYEESAAPDKRRYPLENQTYKIVEIVGSSAESITGAIKSGLASSAESIRQLRWFEVTQIRGHITDGEVGHFQVVMKVGFAVEGE